MLQLFDGIARATKQPQLLPRCGCQTLGGGQVNERIKELAKQAGFDVEEATGGGDVWFDEGWNTELVERFAELVAADAVAKEREACAKLCDLVAKEADDTNGLATYIGNSIRARGDKHE